MNCLLCSTALSRRQKYYCSNTCRAHHRRETTRTQMTGRIITWGDKISNSMRGKKLSAEHKASLCANHVGTLGKKWTDATITKMRECKLGSRNPLYGTHQSDETKCKMRLSAIQYNKTHYSHLWTKIGKNETPLLDAQQIKDNCVIDRQHLIPELGYVVDGYCKNTNTVYEVYERFHNRQKERDIIRQREIENHLGCKFIIIEDK